MIRLLWIALVLSFLPVVGLQGQELLSDTVPTLTERQKKPIVQLSGIITNTKKEGMPFTTIAVINRAQGTVSNFWGYYSIAVHPDDTIRFSSVGHKSFEFTFPDSFSEKEWHADIVLAYDTVVLSETVVFPWTTYDQFLQAVLDLELQDEDMDRARSNIALMQKQLFSEEYQVDASLNYKFYMQDKANQLYTRGQVPTLSLLNPFAWAQFFEALKSGAFTSKKKVY